MREVITIGVDSATTNCGIAIYKNGEFARSENWKFAGTYSLDKLGLITKKFNSLFNKLKPTLILIEETVPVRNSRAVTTLNQVFGAIAALAMVRGIHVNQVHNKTAKKTFKYKTKEEAIAAAHKLTGARNITSHEADAILVVETYKELYT